MGRSNSPRRRPRLPHPRLTRPGIALLLGVTLGIAACAGNGDPNTTTTETTIGGTTGGETTTVPTTMEATLPDLTGDWDNGMLLLEVNDAGEYRVVTSGSGDPVQPLMGGFIAREGNQFSFVTGTTGECPGQTGVYEASIADDVLILFLVDDPCGSRASGFEEPFSRVH